MFKRLVVAGSLLMVVGISACGAAEERDQPTASATSRPSPTNVPTLQQAAPPATTPTAALIDRLKADLAGRSGVSPADITLVSVATMTWPDGCLGLGGPGVVCTQALVPGWLAILRVPGGREYRYRGAGDRFVLEP